MISQQITQLIGNALKSHDEKRLSLLRMLSSALNYEKIKLQHDLSEDEEIAVVRREAKKRNDAIAMLEANREKGGEKLQENIDNEKAEIEILKEFLPSEMSDEALKQVVIEAIDSVSAYSVKDMGKVIGAVKTKIGSTVEGARVAQMAKQALENMA